MNYQDILNFCLENNFQVQNGKLTTSSTVSPKMIEVLRDNKEALVDDLSDVVSFEFKKTEKDERQRLISQIEQIHQKIGMTDFDLDDFSVEDLVEWLAWVKEKLPELLKSEKEDEGYQAPPKQDDTVYSKPEWKVRAVINKNGEKRLQEFRPRRGATLTYHFQCPLVSQFYINLTEVPVAKRNLRRFSIGETFAELNISSRDRKTWSEWNSIFSELVRVRCPHLDPYNPTKVSVYAK
jgi:dsDNA-binding SOS-regulon protein